MFQLVDSHADYNQNYTSNNDNSNIKTDFFLSYKTKEKHHPTFSLLEDIKKF